MTINDPQTVFSDDTQNSLFLIEDESWWFKYRARVIVGLMKLFFNNTTHTVDVGGGNGYTSYVAKENGFDVSILEPSPQACQNAQKRGLEAHIGMLTENYPNDEEYDQVLLLDVLEHIEDDNGFLRLLFCKMSRKGKLLLTVPAHHILWSSEDDHAGHFRRYSERELRNKVEHNGFKVIYSSYYMRFLFIPILFIRVWLERIGLIIKQSDRTEEEREMLRNKQFRTKKGSLAQIILAIAEELEYRCMMKKKRVLYGSSIVMILGKTQTGPYGIGGEDDSIRGTISGRA